jgi:ubiquitin C-terminal hydrolase
MKIGKLLGLMKIKKALASTEELQEKLSEFKTFAQTPEGQSALSDYTSTELELYSRKIETELSKIYLYVGIRELFKQLMAEPSPVEAIDITSFYRLCAFITRGTGMAHIVDGGQNDAVEFLMCLLDYLHDSHSMPAEMEIDPDVLELTDSALDEMPINDRIMTGLKRAMYQRYKQGTSALYNEVYFYMLNIVRCAKCNYMSLNYSPYNILCMPLNKTTPGQTLYDTMDSLFSREVLECEYKCEKCKNTVGNTIEKKLLTPPKTLIICLKRFDFKVFGNGIGVPFKVDVNIAYPPVLDIGKYHPSTSTEYNMYKLKAVVNHMGNLNFGHYYSYCMDDSTGKWGCYNDAQVSVIDERVVYNNPAAYILFYERII